MSKFKIELESMLLPADLERFFDRNDLAVASDVAHLFVEHCRRLFLEKILSDFHDVLECVTVPATGAGDHIIVFRVRDGVHGSIALAAKNSLGFSCH